MVTIDIRMGQPGQPWRVSPCWVLRQRQPVQDKLIRMALHSVHRRILKKQSFLVPYMLNYCASILGIPLI